MRFIGNVEKDAQVRAVASGALSTGDTVVVNSDGTVSVPSSASQSLGTSVEVSGYFSEPAAVYDSSNGKVVVFYRWFNSGYKVEAVVGTVSGTSISFGAAVSLSSASWTNLMPVYDSINEKIVLFYSTSEVTSDAGTARVCTVSGDTLSIGSPSTFNTGQTDEISATFDSSTGKMVVLYRDEGNSNYGTAVVGTVSGTSISFGTEVVFESATINPVVHSVFDSANDKIVIMYMAIDGASYDVYAAVGTVSGTSISFGAKTLIDDSNDRATICFDSINQKVVIAYLNEVDNSGAAVVGTVSGTTISFGSAVQFESGVVAELSSAFDTVAGKVVFFYKDEGNSNYGTLVTGTVSGTSITFGSPLVFESSAYLIFSPASTVYDSGNVKVVSVWRDSSLDGQAIVFQNSYQTLTSENFLGFADSGYADGQSAAINSTCTVDRNQSGLTAGQKYYVQTDGTLGTTAADPSVEAGTAISSTEIIVKG